MGKDKNVDVEMLNHFAAKLSFHDMKTGIIFSNRPISGMHTQGEQYGRLVQTKLFNRHGLIIFHIDTEDIKKILKGKNLIEMLLSKYEEVRLDL